MVVLGRRHRPSALRALLLLLFVLVASGHTPALSGPGKEGGAVPGEPRRGGTLVLLGHHEVAGLSPNDAGPTVTWSVVTQIHNALVEIDENYNVEPVLAERYEVSPDAKRYTFYLRRGVKFHDGTEFTSKDVKYTYEWHMNPNNPSTLRAYFLNVDRVETPDPYTVVVRMKQPDATFLRRGATTFIVPADYHARVGEEKYRTAPIGTGPFKLKEWRPAEYTLLEAFDEHFRGRPYLDFLRLNVVPEPSVRAVALDTGQAHSSVWPLLVEDNLRFEKDARFRVIRTPSTSVTLIPLNNDLPQLSDRQVRQAMMYALDRQRMIDDLFKGAATLATSHLSPAFKEWYEPNVKRYPYDVEQAKRLLDAAGWRPGPDGVRQKDGVRLAFTITLLMGDQARRPVAEAVQQYLKQVGISVSLREAPAATILAALPKGEMDASLFNWTYGGAGGDPDPAETLLSGGARNFSRYRNPRVDELIRAGLREADPQKRRAIYSEIQRIVAEDVPFLFLMYWDWFTVFSAKVKGLPEGTILNGSQLYRKAYQWWLEK